MKERPELKFNLGFSLGFLATEIYISYILHESAKIAGGEGAAE